MEDAKLKSLSLTKTKVAEVDGERRVTFVASSSTEDRDHEHMEIETLRLPLKKGGEMRVAAIPAEGTDLIDIPLLTNHDMWEVEKTIGSVRKAYFENGQLIFEAGISGRDYAQDVFKLIDEGHLDNAFSISVTDYDYNYETGAISNGEIMEVSLVTRGSNKDAQVLSVKAMKGKSMEGTPEPQFEETKVPETEATVEEPEDKEKSVVTGETAEPVEEPAEEPKIEEPTEEPEEVAEEVSETEPVEKSVETKSNVKEKSMDKEIAKSVVAEKADQTVTAKATNSEYLKSKQAMVDFAHKIVSMKGQSSADILKSWSADLKAKNVGGDAILPSQLEQIFFKTWEDNNSILGTFRTIRSNAAAVNAFTGEGENIRAKGHKKGDNKAGQQVVNVRRDLKQKIIYKMLAIDLQDLLDDQTGELSRFRAEELAERVAHEIVLGAILGDGRTAPGVGQPDYRVFDGTRGLFSMAADIAASTDATNNPFAAIVARTVANTATDNYYDKIIKTIAQVKDGGFGKSIVVPAGTISALKLLKGQDGHYIFEPGRTIEDTIGANIFELDEMAGSGFDVIAYANQRYALYATNDMVRTQFNITTNEDVMLVERSTAGSLYGNRAAAGYVSGESA